MLNFPTPGANYRLCSTYFTISLVGLGFTLGASWWHQRITVTGLNLIWRNIQLKVKPLIWCKNSLRVGNSWRVVACSLCHFRLMISWIPTILRAKESKIKHSKSSATVTTTKMKVMEKLNPLWRLLRMLTKIWEKNRVCKKHNLTSTTHLRLAWQHLLHKRC